MSWQNLIISKPAVLKLKHNSLLCIQSEIVSLPLEDIATITLESPRVSLTAALLSRLSSEGIALITCNREHMPNGLMLSFNAHSRLKNVLEAQIAWTKEFRNQVWQCIVKQKIQNQAEVLKLSGKASEYLYKLSERVEWGDKKNYEAQAARYYFANLWKGFKRKKNDRINAALNYGYAILRAAIARELVSFGFQPVLGIQHASELNSFNLADDLIEAYRPFVDQWSIQNLALDNDEAKENDALSKYDRAELNRILQVHAYISKSKQSILGAIRITVKSLSSATHYKDYSLIALPQLNSTLETRAIA